jgi:hypothetical protein
VRRVGGVNSRDLAVNSMWPTNELDAQALRPAIAGLLTSIPLTWTEFDSDQLSARQSQALYLLTAAGMVDRRFRCRVSFANHPVQFELQIQATGESGYELAMQSATAIQFKTWSDAWIEWSKSDTKELSPFHIQLLRPEEWRLTDQGELARDDLSGKTPGDDPAIVFDFVLQQGFFGPGFWARQLYSGRPLTDDEARVLESHQFAGTDFTKVTRPPHRGSGTLLAITQVEESKTAQDVRLTNWTEGAMALGKVLGDVLQRGFTAKSDTRSDDPVESPAEIHPPEAQEVPAAAGSTPFDGGELVFFADRVELCGIVICSGKRSRSKRIVLELLGGKWADGNLAPFSGEELTKEGISRGAKGTAAQWVRDLRASISDRLFAQAGIKCGPDDLIVSGGEGYRLSPALSVQFVDQTMIGDIGDMEAKADVPNVPDRDVPNVPDGGSQARREWILAELSRGVRLKAVDIAKHFGKDRKTALRDLKQLRNEGKIDFVGDPRTGCYRLKSG